MTEWRLLRNHYFTMLLGWANRLFVLNPIVGLQYTPFHRLLCRCLGMRIPRTATLSPMMFVPEFELLEFEEDAYMGAVVEFRTSWVERTAGLSSVVRYAKITVGERAFVGPCAVILPGVTIRRDAMVTECSLALPRCTTVPSGYAMLGMRGRMMSYKPQTATIFNLKRQSNIWLHDVTLCALGYLRSSSNALFQLGLPVGLAVWCSYHLGFPLAAYVGGVEPSVLYASTAAHASSSYVPSVASSSSASSLHGRSGWQGWHGSHSNAPHGAPHPLSDQPMIALAVCSALTAAVVASVIHPLVIAPLHAMITVLIMRLSMRGIDLSKGRIYGVKSVTTARWIATLCTSQHGRWALDRDSSFWIGSSLPRLLYRLAGAKVGRHAFLPSSFPCQAEMQLIRIGDCAHLLSAPRSVLGYAHNFVKGYLTFEPVTFGRAVTITGGVMVCPGSTIPDGATVLPYTVLNLMGRVGEALAIVQGHPPRRCKLNENGDFVHFGSNVLPWSPPQTKGASAWTDEVEDGAAFGHPMSPYDGKGDDGVGDGGGEAAGGLAGGSARRRLFLPPQHGALDDLESALTPARSASGRTVRFDVDEQIKQPQRMGAAASHRYPPVSRRRRWLVCCTIGSALAMLLPAILTGSIAVSGNGNGALLGAVGYLNVTASTYGHAAAAGYEYAAAAAAVAAATPPHPHRHIGGSRSEYHSLSRQPSGTAHTSFGRAVMNTSLSLELSKLKEKLAALEADSVGLQRHSKGAIQPELLP